MQCVKNMSLLPLDTDLDLLIKKTSGFQAPLSNHCQDDGCKHKKGPETQSLNHFTKIRKINKPWPKSIQVWRRSGYISMPKCRSFFQVPANPKCGPFHKVKIEPKIRKIHRPWQKSTPFWRESRHQHNKLYAIPSMCYLEKNPRKLSGRTDYRSTYTDQHYVPIWWEQKKSSISAHLQVKFSSLTDWIHVILWVT